MKRNDETRMCGAVDQEAFEKVIRDSLSPEGVTAVIAFLQTASGYGVDNPQRRQALQQVRWLADTLLEMLGVAEFNRLIDEIGL
jgi:hypothetical protein